jgi:uncharacterized protein YecE (DUF72 family)
MAPPSTRFNIGTAGWSIPRAVAGAFPSDGTSLERYAAHFGVAEINSSFHRPHRASTWDRWRDSVPDHFRFSVKLPKTITHQAKLVETSALVADFLKDAERLTEKLATLLVQLPPKLALDASVARSFFGDLANRTQARIACEPRNASWFTPDSDALLAELRVARVAADPAMCEAAAHPGGARDLAYFRLHGSPVIYRSSYGDRICSYAEQLEAEREGGADVWCIFDNTASSAATADALALTRALSQA